MWTGLSKVGNLIAETTTSLADESTPTIGLGPFLQLFHAEKSEIIDMRLAQDYDRLHIKDALNVSKMEPAGTEEQLVNNLKKARNIILYSNDGVSDEMHQYADYLHKQGIYAVFFYSGGFNEWHDAGLPVEEGNHQNQ